VNSGWTHEATKSSAWESWFSQHVPGLLLYARQRAGSEAEAQDLVQEAVVESWRRCGGEEPPPVPLVYATIRRRALDEIRQHDRRREREQASQPEEATWFDTAVEEAERAAFIQKAMRELPPMYSEVISLKIWGGLTFAEIGEALDIPQNTAASRYRYGLEELRKITRGIEA
jgi:RNA polymerase sigma-70 factor (ECF subfamily)